MRIIPNEIPMMKYSIFMRTWDDDEDDDEETETDWDVLVVRFRHKRC